MKTPFLRAPIATLAVNMRPVRGPWGGSSPFVQQLRRFLGLRGWRVQFRLDPAVDAILLIDPRDDLQSGTFGMREIRAHKERHPGVRVVHRINECDQRKGSGFMDALLGEANTVADHTIFISEWLRDYFTARGFTTDRPYSVIYNGADPAVFHPIGAALWDGSGPLRVITHHWSDNPLKGFDLYERVDALIADGALPGVELQVVGRWPASIRWRAALTHPPCAGHRLAGLLRGAHLYLTATRWEPCGMHHVEGAQCGLPLLYHEDGGGVVEAGRRYGIGFREDPAAALRAAAADLPGLRERVLRRMPSGDRMCVEYATLLQGLLASRTP